MFGGGDNRSMSAGNEELHNNSMAMVVSVPPNNNSEGQSSPFPGDNMQNGMLQRSQSVVNHSKKLEDDLQELGKKIKHHEDNVNFLKSQMNKVDSSILELQVAIGKLYMASSSKEENGDRAIVDSKEKAIQNILKYKNSAAALLCQITSEASDRFLIKDVVGVVATLGKIDDPNLSRLLSQYLGLDNMLAVVCRTYEGVKSLESYSIDGSIYKGLGIHAFAESVGSPLDGQFNVFCIETLRPYTGEVVADDPQRRLNLLKPRLINGQTPPGFLGFAVNMIMIDNEDLYSVSGSGHTLRETLFYNLFLNLQVYQSREDMLKAIPFISNGAISLDGGVIRSPGVFSLGHHRGDIDVMFPCTTKNSTTLPVSYFDTANQLKETKWKKDRVLEDIEREQQLLEHVRFRYETKKREFVRFLAESSSFATQVARVSTPR